MVQTIFVACLWAILSRDANKMEGLFYFFSWSCCTYFYFRLCDIKIIASLVLSKVDCLHSSLDCLRHFKAVINSAYLNNEFP